MTFYECLVTYSPSNEIINTILLLEKGIRLDLTLFLDEEDPQEIAFSVERNKVGIFNGVGAAEDIAAGMNDLINDLKAGNGVLS